MVGDVDFAAVFAHDFAHKAQPQTRAFVRVRVCVWARERVKTVEYLRLAGVSLGDLTAANFYGLDTWDDFGATPFAGYATDGDDQLFGGIGDTPSL